MFPALGKVISPYSSKFQLNKLRILLLFVGYLLFVALFLLPVPAQAAPQILDSTNFNYLINGQTTIEGSVFHTINCGIGGFSPYYRCLGYRAGNSKPGIVYDSSQPATPLVFDRLPNGGALGSTAFLMGGMYANPPASSGYYLANLGRDFGLVQPVYAQSVIGSGQAIVAPVYNLWQAVRNLAYAAFIIIIIAIGFMIMFRQRINPQTVVTIQQAIPSIIIGLALVTFSYFIAALIIDLAFYGVQIVVFLFDPGRIGGRNIFGETPQLNDLAHNGNVFRMFTTAGLNGEALGRVAGGTFGQLMTSFGYGPFLTAGLIAGVLGFLTANLPLVLGSIGAVAAPALIPGLVIVILLIALFVQMIRLAFSLLMSYIQLLVLTIVGPFYILWGSIPGRGGTISYWIRGLLANTLVFPAVFAAFLFAGVILGNTNNLTATLPLFGGVSPDFIKVLIAYGILLGSPAVPDMVRQAFKWQGPQGIAQAAMGGAMVGVGASQTFSPYATQAGGGFLNRRLQRYRAAGMPLPGWMPAGAQRWTAQRVNQFQRQAREMATPRRR